MDILRFLLWPFRRFKRDESASISVEAVLVLPLLFWGYFGMFILFDAYRSLAANIRAAYTIGDLLSRETGEVTPAYIEGLNDIQDVLTQSPYRTVLRVTTVRYSDSDGDGEIDSGEHSLEWSYSTGGKEAITPGQMDTKILPYLPAMADASVLVVVETWMAFVPFMNLSLANLYQPSTEERKVSFGPFYFEGLVATRPRFAGQLVWNADG